MASSSAAAVAAQGPSYEWLVIIPDKPGTRHLRLEARPQHLTVARKYMGVGLYAMSGAILNQVPTDDEPANLDFAGSSFVMQAASRDEILAVLQQDVYAINVWDLDMVQMWPFKCAFRKAW